MAFISLKYGFSVYREIYTVALSDQILLEKAELLKLKTVKT